MQVTKPDQTIAHRLPALACAALLALGAGPAAAESRSKGATLAPTKASQLFVAAARHATDCTPFALHVALDEVQEADGTETPFAIPADKVFVLTSAELLAHGLTPGGLVGLQLIRSPEASSVASLIAARDVRADAHGTLSHRFEFPTPVAVKSGIRVCAKTQDLEDLSNTVAPFVMAYGFLVDDK